MNPNIIIEQAKKKMGKSGTLPVDDIINLYKEAKEGRSNKLMTFIKTIKPLNENFIKRSTLYDIVGKIIKEILNERYVEEDSTTGAASPVTGPNIFKKKKIMNEIDFDFEDPKNKSNFTSAEKKLIYAYLRLHEDTNFDDLAQILSNELKAHITAGELYAIWSDYEYGDSGGPERSEESIDEMTVTGDVAGYNIPGAFSRKGGSAKAVKGSESLGYTLTPLGKKEMKRSADKLY